MSNEEKILLMLENMATKDDIAEIKTDLKTLKTDVKTLKTDVRVLKTDVKALKADMKAVKTDIKRIDDRIDTLAISQLRIAEWTEKANIRFYNLEYIQAQLGSAAAALKDNYSGLDKKIDDNYKSIIGGIGEISEALGKRVDKNTIDIEDLLRKA
jgi:outer membrane murein-binding lipoprotein Lpp